MRATLWITGVAGFTGRHLVRHVAARPDRPRLVGLDDTEPPDLPLDDYVRLDLTDGDGVETAARAAAPDWVIHLAGSTRAGTDLWRANVGSTLGLAVGLHHAGCRPRLLGIGSAAEYASGDGRPIAEDAPVGPTSDYGRAKLAQTLLTLGLEARLGLPALVARAFNLIGPGLPPHLVAGRLCAQFASGDSRAITLQHVATSRDFLDVRDAVDAYWRLVRHGRPGEVYNVCSGTATGLPALVDAFARATATQPVVEETGAHDGRQDPSVVVGCPDKIRRAVDWMPQIALEASVTDMLAAVGRRG